MQNFQQLHLLLLPPLRKVWGGGGVLERMLLRLHSNKETLSDVKTSTLVILRRPLQLLSQNELHTLILRWANANYFKTPWTIEGEQPLVFKKSSFLKFYS